MLFLRKNRHNDHTLICCKNPFSFPFLGFFHFFGKTAQEFVKNSNFFFIFHVYISEMAKMRKIRVRATRKSLLFTPPFFEGFKIDPLII